MLQVPHEHVPLFRVVRAAWAEPLDSSYSRERGGRWNPPGAFPALYGCCSERVAGAVVRDLWRTGAIEAEDLSPAARPQLVEFRWAGTVVDAVSLAGLAAAGLTRGYPAGLEHRQTQALGSVWHEAGAEGVVCRSASLHRLGFRAWVGPHEGWGEVAVFVENATAAPELLRRRADAQWLLAAPAPR